MGLVAAYTARIHRNGLYSGKRMKIPQLSPSRDNAFASRGSPSIRFGSIEMGFSRTCGRSSRRHGPRGGKKIRSMLWICPRGRTIYCVSVIYILPHCIISCAAHLRQLPWHYLPLRIMLYINRGRTPSSKTGYGLLYNVYILFYLLDALLRVSLNSKVSSP